MNSNMNVSRVVIQHPKIISIPLDEYVDDGLGTRNANFSVRLSCYLYLPKDVR